MQVLKRDSLPLGGFAGVRERQLVMDRRLFKNRSGPGTWSGFGGFVYLADARFIPFGETGMHAHRDIDVISVMVEGRICHAGSLHDGQEMRVDEVQVQRAGGAGFSHNEINPDQCDNRMIQVWVLPESTNGPAVYQFFTLERGRLTRVYGGPAHQDQTLASQTLIDIGVLDDAQRIAITGPFLAYISRGEGLANDRAVTEGDLLRGEDLTFQAARDTQLIVVHTLR